MSIRHSPNGEIHQNKADVALALSPLIGMKIMLNYEEGVSVTTIDSLKVISSESDSMSIVLYTKMGTVTIHDNKKMKEILIINSIMGNVETMYSLVSDVFYF